MAEIKEKLMSLQVPLKYHRNTVVELISQIRNNGSLSLSHSCRN
jgi:hypothetical protein